MSLPGVDETLARLDRLDRALASLPKRKKKRGRPKKPLQGPRQLVRRPGIDPKTLEPHKRRLKRVKAVPAPGGRPRLPPVQGPKRPRGRPKGSKNRLPPIQGPRLPRARLPPIQGPRLPPIQGPKKRRGRPPGAKNKNPRARLPPIQGPKRRPGRPRGAKDKRPRRPRAGPLQGPRQLVRRPGLNPKTLQPHKRRLKPVKPTGVLNPRGQRRRVNIPVGSGFHDPSELMRVGSQLPA